MQQTKKQSPSSNPTGRRAPIQVPTPGSESATFQGPIAVHPSASPGFPGAAFSSAPAWPTPTQTGYGFAPAAFGQPMLAYGSPPAPAMLPYFGSPYAAWSHANSPFAAWSQASHSFPQYQPPTTGNFPGSPVAIPPVDIVDEGAEFVCQVDLPGVKPEALEVVSSNQGLLVNAVREPELDIAALLQSERANATFRRSIALPEGIHPDQVRATLRDGVLTINAPKVNPTEGTRRVEVQR